MPYSKSKQLVFFLIFFAIFSSCKKEEKKTTKAIVKELQDSIPETNSGTFYTDSMVNILIGHGTYKRKPIKISKDTALQLLATHNFPNHSISHFNIDTLHKYETINHPLSASQKQLLDATDYFGDYTFSEKFKCYLFYNKSEESHYSNSIELRTISTTTNQINKFTLAQFYGSENYEKIITSKFIAKDSIERVVKQFFGPRNSKGKMDNNSQPKIYTETYFIQKNGKISPHSYSSSN